MFRLLKKGQEFAAGLRYKLVRSMSSLESMACFKGGRLLRVGVHSIRGRRAEQEDSHVASLRRVTSVGANLDDENDLHDDQLEDGHNKKSGHHLLVPLRSSVIAVFDGHGGSVAAEYCSQRIPALLREKEPLEAGEKGMETLKWALEKVEEEFLVVAKERELLDGTTACVVVVLDDGTLLHANVGDSEAVLCRRKTSVVAVNNNNVVLESPSSKKSSSLTKLEEVKKKVSPPDSRNVSSPSLVVKKNNMAEEEEEEEQEEQDSKSLKETLEENNSKTHDLSDYNRLQDDAIESVALSEVHNPSKNAEEAQRILHMGGRMYGSRLCHPVLAPQFCSIAVSRSIGDYLFKGKEFTFHKESALIGTPYVSERKLQKEDLFVIVACDGIWDSLSYDDACRLVFKVLQETNSPQMAAEELVNEAYDRGSMDNCTAVICTFVNKFT